MALEKITIGGGCFWCLEAVFSELEGVESIVSGYAGGSVENPNYMQVCTGSTGHAEVVQLEFENDVILLRSIFEVFFSAHDPTTLNRQGADVGTQYRSVIFYHLDNQKDEAENIIRELDGSKAWSDPIVTEVLPFPGFYPAEEYHKNYYSQNTTQNYCQIVISPKISKVREKFKNILKRS